MSENDKRVPGPAATEPESTEPGATEPADTKTADVKTDRSEKQRSTLYNIVAGDVFAGVLAVLLSVLVGSIMIAATNDEVRSAASYLFARPGDFFNAVLTSVWDAYTALFRGAIYNYTVDSFQTQIRPLTETLKYAAPLILAGLGVGIAFRAALFNIGGRGQMLLAGSAAGYVGFSWDLPLVIHLPLAILAGMLFGAVWGGLSGLLKARTGAHEVITTIMLNWVAYYLVLWALKQSYLLKTPGSVNPKSPPMKDSAILPKLLGDRFNLHWGFVLALIAVAIAWWLMSRSTLGYRIRAVGENPNAARASGIDVGRTYVLVMAIAGALVGLAGVNQVLGTTTSGVAPDLDAGIGFDAITVALLGRSRPLGILAAGLLFGALKAGGFTMQASENIGVDLVLVVQSLIVLFLAAPPLVRAIFRLPAKEEK